MSKHELSRRTLLRGILGGATISIGLPLLEAMLDTNGLALADGKPIPKRFGVWFWGNGVRRAHWIPNGVGKDWTPGEELQPLAKVKDYVTVVTGMAQKAATHPHHSGMAAIMTGAKYHQNGKTRDTIVSTFARPSIDQVVAEAWKGRAPYRSLELGVCRFRGTDEGTTFQHLSHNGPNNVNPSEYSPSVLFDRLFKAGTTPQVSSARTSVLDVVSGDARDLQRRLGAGDKVRLDQHLESLRALEKRLQTSPALCATPAKPGAFPDDMGREQIEPVTRAMADLLAMALACDLTRVFSVLFSTAGAGTVFWQAGAGNSMHQMCHDEGNPQPTVHRATVFTMQMLAHFLERLKSVPEGPGNLLDHCAILCTTELSEGNTHSNDEFPILFAGKAGGRLRSGVHYRSPSRENTTMALLTLLRAVDLPFTEFGAGGGHVTAPIGSLLL